MSYLANGTAEPVCRTTRGMQTQRKDLWTQQGKERVRGIERVAVTSTHDHVWSRQLVGGCRVTRGLSRGLCDDLGVGRGGGLSEGRLKGETICAYLRLIHAAGWQKPAQHCKSISEHLRFYFFTLQYCIGFSIHQHESAMGVHVFPILNPLPTSLPIPSLWVIPVHQPQAFCILHQTWTGDSFLTWYYTCFNAVLPDHPPPSPTESKRLFYTSVSLLLSRIQGYRYYLSKFHIYALVYCTGVFLSGLLHSV